MPIYGHFCVKIVEFSPTFTENEPKSPKIRYFSFMYPIFNHFSIKFQSKSGTFDWVQIFYMYFVVRLQRLQSNFHHFAKKYPGYKSQQRIDTAFCVCFRQFCPTHTWFLVFETVKRPLYHNKQIK